MKREEEKYRKECLLVRDAAHFVLVEFDLETRGIVFEKRGSTGISKGNVKCVCVCARS